MKTYEYTLMCHNCLQKREYLIPFGTTISAYIKKNKILCQHCGCDVRRKR